MTHKCQIFECQKFTDVIIRELEKPLREDILRVIRNKHTDRTYSDLDDEPRQICNNCQSQQMCDRKEKWIEADMKPVFLFNERRA